MHSLSLEQLKRHFAYCGMPVTGQHERDALRWRMYQWKRLGLMYFAEAVDRLLEEGEVEACTLIPPPDARAPRGDTFVPSPFPILGHVYEYLAASHKIDRVAFLTALAYFKLSHEHGASHAAFESDDEYGLYCAFIDRFYATDQPYKGKKIYWILFDEQGVAFFSQEFDLAPERLGKFTPRPPRAAPPSPFARN